MKFNHILSGLALTAAVLAAGCQKSLEYSDVVYFTGTENSNITNMYVDGPSSMGVTVTSSCKMAADVQVALAVDAAAVDAYNALHGTDYRMLPKAPTSRRPPRSKSSPWTISTKAHTTAYR